LPGAGKAKVVAIEQTPIAKAPTAQAEARVALVVLGRNREPEPP